MKQDHYLYIYGTERLPVGLDTLEDEIFDQIDGQGDVTGTGTGEKGWNIDIEFESLNSANFILMSSLKVFRLSFRSAGAWEGGSGVTSPRRAGKIEV